MKKKTGVRIQWRDTPYVVYYLITHKIMIRCREQTRDPVYVWQYSTSKQIGIQYVSLKIQDFARRVKDVVIISQEEEGKKQYKTTFASAASPT